MATSTTTNYSFPYPLGSDSLSNVALRIQQLAEYIDSTYTILGVDLSSNAAFIQTGDAAGGNLTGTYPNPTISTSVVLPNGTFAVTQSQYDGSTKLATTSYVDTAALNFTLGTIPPLSVTNAMLAGSITYAKLILTNSIVNADVATGAAIDKTKISGTAVTIADTGTVTSTMLLDGTILNADVNASAAIAYSKLNLGTSIVNADVSATAAIVDTKLATISTASKVSNSATTATDANTASAIVARDASGNFTAGMITANVTGALTGNASTVTTNANLTGDVTSVGNATSIASGVIVNADVNTSAAISYSKLNLATSIVNADVSASAAIAYSKLALTGAILNADLAGSIDPSKVTGTAVVTADSRLSDARTPTAHASTHIPGGTDVLNFSAFSGQGSSLPGSLTLYPAGSLFAVGAAAPYLIYRSNGTSWDQLGASAITTSDTAPASPQLGDLWYQSSTGKQFIRYDSFWVEMGNNTNASVSNHASSHTEGGSDAVSVTLNQVPNYQSYRNVIINGGMSVAQRGTSVASITTANYYTADRWTTNSMGSLFGTWTQSVENDAPTGSGHRKSLKMLITAGAGTPGASTSTWVGQNIEGQNIQHIAKGTSSAKQLTVQFWVKANVTGTYIFELYDVDNTRQVSGSYTILASATWEKKTIIIPLDTTGAFDNDNNNSMVCIFHLAAATTYTSGTLNTTWGAAVAANRAVGQVNLAAATSNYWQVTGVQLEAGSVATPFEFEPFETTLRKCQRYYEKSYNVDVVPGTNTTTGQYISSVSSTAYTGYLVGHVSFKVPKRSSTLVLQSYDSINGAVGKVTRENYGATQTSVNFAADLIGETGFRVLNTGAAGNGLGFHWTASAEL